MSGVISDSDSLKAMTDVYDAIIDASPTWAVRHQIAAFGVETAPAGITVIAMGRYGGREVNFSSDADAILIYRPADDADDGQANAFAKKVVEDLRNILQGPTTLEPKIELDLDLRPEGKNGPLVRSYASCEEYYESWASTWERQALLRARYAAGDAELARDFLINIADPLRYPTTELTEAELQNIRKLKARMEAERLPRGVRRERHLKLGKGGLSDVEWTVQLMQLQHAGDIRICASTARWRHWTCWKPRSSSALSTRFSCARHGRCAPRPATATICGAGAPTRPIFCLMTSIRWAVSPSTSATAPTAASISRTTFWP